MSWSLIAACLWVLAATVVAFLPIRRQFVPVVVLLPLAVLILGFIGYEHGWIFAVIGLLGFLSMFRNPLRFIWRKLKGENPQLPQ